MTDDEQNTSKMQDISLAAEEQHSNLSEDPNTKASKKDLGVPAEKQLSKSNSLKRFFKLNYKKVEASEINKVEATKNEKKCLQCLPDEPRRFHLRVGNRQKHLDAAESEEMPSSSRSSSKLTLKRSINKYWHTLFKGPKTDSTQDVPNTTPNLVLKSNYDDKNKEEDSSSDENDEEIVNINRSNPPQVSEASYKVISSSDNVENSTNEIVTELSTDIANNAENLQESESEPKENIEHILLGD